MQDLELVLIKMLAEGKIEDYNLELQEEWVTG